MIEKLTLEESVAKLIDAVQAQAKKDEAIFIVERLKAAAILTKRGFQ